MSEQCPSGDGWGFVIVKYLPSIVLLFLSGRVRLLWDVQLCVWNVSKREGFWQSVDPLCFQ